MMANFRASARAAKIAMFWVGIAAFLSACSTVPPAPNPRVGLIAKIVQLDRASSRNRREIATIEEVGSDGKIPASVHGFLRWPLKQVQVTSRFGRRGSNYHEGLDLRAPIGTPVYAAQAGTVIYSGSRIRGYGLMVVVSHMNGITTVYAHQSKLFVKKGQKVKLGQRIGLSGNTGRSTGPHLHFEVRHGVAALDPLRVMPSVQRASNEEQSLPRERQKRSRKVALK